jgi:Flp pilus assembly protein TadG
VSAGARERVAIVSRNADEHGAVAVMLAVMLTVMLGITALVVDLGNARQQRRAAQNSADAAALAAGETVEAGSGTINWDAVVAQVKKYAKVNDGVATEAWVGCTDASALTFRPDSGANANTCISADRSSWPVVGSGTVGDTVNQVRVKLPTTSVKSYFGKVLGIDSLTTGAVATTKVVMTVQQIVVPEQVAGGPCALCILGSGLALDGQNGDVTITGGNVIVNSTTGTGASLNPNGHVKISTDGGSIGGPGSCGPTTWCNNFSGGLLAAASQLGGDGPARNVPQCGNGSPDTTDYCAGLLAQTNGNEERDAESGVYNSIPARTRWIPGSTCSRRYHAERQRSAPGSGVMLYRVQSVSAALRPGRSVPASVDRQRRWPCRGSRPTLCAPRSPGSASTRACCSSPIATTRRRTRGAGTARTRAVPAPAARARCT